MNLKSSHRAIACVGLLLGVNFYVARDLFTLEWSRHMGSAEGAFIAMARYALGNWPDLAWFPLWYGGIPYQNAYPPLLHLVVAAVAALGRISPALSYHAVSAVVYCLAPLTLFWMAWRLSGDRSRSLFASLAYSLVSPTLFLARELRQDTGGALMPRRFHSLVLYGDTPHLAGLALLPVAVVLLDRALARRSPGACLLAALALAAVPLTNWIAAFALALAVIACLASRPASFKDCLLAVALAAAAYLIACPWVPPSTLAAIRTNSYWRSPQDRVEMSSLLYWVPLAAAAVLATYLAHRRRVPPFLRFALLLALPLAWVTLAYYWFGVVMIPQPLRYHIEADLALCLLAAFGLATALARLPAPARWALAAGLVAFGAFQVNAWRRFARDLCRTGDVRSTMEYKTAAWFERNMTGRRVMASGSGHLYLNAFTDVAQLSGGFEQGITNITVPQTIHVFYKAWNEIDPNGEVTILMMRALGVHAMCVGGPNSRDYYRPHAHPERFASSGLPVLWREGDDVIYGIPARSSSLAHVVAREDLVKHRPDVPFHLEEVQRYVAALENPSYPLAEFAWRSAHQARVTADLRPGQVLSIQISHHPGWHATVNGEARPMVADGLGLMAVDARCEGRCVVDLVYDGGREATLARWLSWGTILCGLAWWGASARSKA